VNDNTTPQRCGLIAVVGAPNAGKSTLVNALVGQKVAIVSPKAQTTRARLLGVAIEGDAQLLLVDTPGIFEPRRRFDRAMVSAAWGGTEGADLLALVVDAKGGLGAKVTDIAEALKDRPEPKHLILNKVDLADKAKLLLHAERLNALVPFAETWFVSAATGDGLPELKRALAAAMPAGPWHYPEDQVSDATERALAAEVTREQIYLQLHAELPYASAVETEKFEERADGSVEIHQQVLVERPTQRAIVLGKGGARIREIGARARGPGDRARPAGAPLPAREGEARLGRGSPALQGYRAGLGGVITSRRSCRAVPVRPNRRFRRRRARLPR
jgi:GTP-binding protein Era